MKIWSLALCLFPLCSIRAQITLTRSDFMSIGDTVQQITADVGNRTPGPSGPNQTWDFSTLTDNGEANPAIMAVTPASTPYATQYPGTNFVLMEQPDGNDNFSYYQLNEQEFTLYGVAGLSDDGEVVVIYDDREEHIHFPFSYNDKVNDTFHATYSSNGISFERNGTSEVEADAYGTLVLPQGTFHDVLRFKTVQEMTDVGAGFTIETKVESYSWMAKGMKWPLLVFSFVETNAGGIEIEASSIEYLGEGDGTNQNSRFMSHVTREGGGFQTRLLLRNHGEQEQTVVLTPYTKDGLQGNSVEEVVPAGGFLEVQPSSLLGSDVSHFSLDQGSGVSVTAAYKTASGNGASAHIHANEQVGTSFDVFPGEWDLVFDGLALVNRGSEASSVLLEQVELNGSIANQVMVNASLAPNAKELVVFDTHFNALPGSIIRVTTSQLCSATFLRGSPPSVEPAYLFTNPPKPEIELAQSRWIAHVTRFGGGYTTQFTFQNRTNSQESVVLAGFLADGTSAASVQVDVPAGTSVMRSHEELFGNTEISHFQIVGSSDVVVSAAYKIAQGEGASAHVHESSSIGESFWIYTGETEYIFDGMAAINLGNAPAQITATMWDSQGNLIDQVTIEEALPPFSKTLAVFGNLFPNQNGIIRIQSDQDMMPVFLRGTPLGVSPGYLYTNDPLD